MTTLSINEINLLVAQNEKLKEQNRSLQMFVKEQGKLITELQKQKGKAYVVRDSVRRFFTLPVVVWAESAPMAKSKAIKEYPDFAESEFKNLRARHAEYWDKYAAEGCVPIGELLLRGWWMKCRVCGEYFCNTHVNDGEAFLVNPDTVDGFIHGELICRECKENKND